MVYHVPDMMKHFGNVKQFSGQGAPIYFYIYLYIYIYIPLQMNQELRRITMMQGGITGQVIVGMLLERGREHERAHRQYTKRNLGGWDSRGKEKKAETTIIYSTVKIY